MAGLVRDGSDLYRVPVHLRQRSRRSGAADWTHKSPPRQEDPAATKPVKGSRSFVPC